MPYSIRPGEPRTDARPAQRSKFTIHEQRIGFLVTRDFHHAILDPVYEELRHDYPCQMTTRVEDLFAAPPRVLIFADRHDRWLRRKLPETAFVFTRHGFASKNYAAGAFAGCDFACVSSPWVQNDCINRGWLPRLGYWVTGFVPMDGVLRRDIAPTQPSIPDLPLGGPTILFAPTYNRGLNAGEILDADWMCQVRRLVPEARCIIKPHPLTAVENPACLELLRESARRDERTVLLDDPAADLYQLLPMTDVLVTDVSSVMFYFLAFDRPIVLVNNPKRSAHPQYYDPAGMEWQWRDMGLQVDRQADLVSAIERSLAHPEELAAARKPYRDRVFGTLVDGRTAERIAAKVRALLEPTDADRPWVDLAWNSIHQLARLDTELQTREQELLRALPNRVRRLPRRMTRWLSRFRGAITGTRQRIRK